MDVLRRGWSSANRIRKGKNTTKQAFKTSGARNNIDFEYINSKAMHKNVPAALSFAVNNAAKKIGRLFGSHLNSTETIG